MKGLALSNQFRPTVAHIDLAALRHNLDVARELGGPGIGMMGVVKANAYGHGALRVASELAGAGIEALAVATPEEGIELREGGIDTPLYVFGGPFQASGGIFLQNRLSPVVFNREQVEVLHRDLSAPLEFHLKVDTGMTRLGILPEEFLAFLKFLKNFPRLHLTGVFTHLATADTSFDGATARQYERFEEVEKIVRKEAPGVKIFHLANSAALLGRRLGPCQMARPGIMLYGSNPHPRLEEGRRLKPVMRFETEILSLKTVPAGTAVSYGGDWVARRESRIAVLPVGYADGYIRHLSGRGEVMIRGKIFPVVGRVCMDLTMIDVTEGGDIECGEKVLLWGPGLAAEAVAEKADTISYELFCAVSRRVPRRYGGSLR